MGLDVDTQIAVLGAGTMGAGIAQVAANAGHTVYLFDIDNDAIARGIEKIRKGLDRLVARGKLSQQECDDLIGRIVPATELSQLADVSLVIEAIVEKLEVKQSVFSALEKICSDTCIFASNTSSISITAIGAGIERPNRLLGMHFFNPAPILKLVEVVKGVATDDGIAQTIYDTALAWNKSPVFAKSSPGFIVNRVARPFYAEGLRVLEEGGSDAVNIDAIIREGGGFRMGPFELMDLIGHDINYAVTSSVFDAFYQDGRFKPSITQLELINAGFLGRKSGRGFYDYQSDGKPSAANVAEATVPKKEAAAPEIIAATPKEETAAPKNIVLEGQSPQTDALARQAELLGIEVERKTSAQPASIIIDGVVLKFTDGRSATERASRNGIQELVLFDLALDYDSSNRMVICKADQASNDALSVATGFFQAINKQVSVIDDIPGMVVMRTVCMIINEAMDVINQSIATAKDIDIAMCKGVNYPKGPLAWCDEIGVASVMNVMQNLHHHYAEERYRPASLLRRKAITNFRFYS